MLTAYPHLAPYLFAALAVFSALMSLGVLLYCRRLLLQDFPGKRTINELRIEISDFSGMVADLTERFNRFQKKEGMRAVRLQKADEQSVLDQAREIATQEPAPEPVTGKLDLYRRARKLQ